MDNASQILIVAGMFVLGFGFLLGIPMALARSKASKAPRYLLAAHLAAVIQGGVLLALTIAMDFSTLSPGAETLAAVLLVGGVALFDLGLVLNWMYGVQDAFAENSLGNKISSIGTPLLLIGTGIVIFGVVGTVL